MRRFYIAQNFNELSSISSVLDSLGYTEKDPCIDNYTYQKQKLFIDTTIKSFWYIDDECIVQSKSIIADKYNDTTKFITLKEIELWLNN